MYCFPDYASAPDRPRVTGTCLDAFAGAAEVESLELLDAVIASRDLAPLSAIPKLSSVGLPNAIDAGIRSGVLQGMKHLQELRLRGVKKVTDASLDDLAKFGHLKTISVRGVGISNDGVERLKKEMPETHVFR